MKSILFPVKLCQQVFLGLYHSLRHLLPISEELVVVLELVLNHVEGGLETLQLRLHVVAVPAAERNFASLLIFLSLEVIAGPLLLYFLRFALVKFPRQLLVLLGQH